MDRLKPCPFCGEELFGTKDRFTNGTSWRCPNGCIEKMKQPMPDEEFYQRWNNRPIEDSLRGAMKADDERLRNAAKKAGVGYYGCDTADHMADVILSLSSARDEWKSVAKELSLAAQSFANYNPWWSLNGEKQDAEGVHAALEHFHKLIDKEQRKQ